MHSLSHSSTFGRPPRILHLSTFDTKGGAARATYDLHVTLGDIGIHSQMLVGRKYGDDHDVFPAYSRLISAIRSRLDYLPLHGYRKTSEAFWSTSWFTGRVPEIVAKLAPDIIHLHWAGAGFLSISALARLNRPIVWTMHDMWAFTGGCHYTGSCSRYRVGCGQCPQLRSSRQNDLSRRIFLKKKTNWEAIDLHLVGISKWLADRAKESSLFDGLPVTVIPDGIDMTRFRPDILETPVQQAEKRGPKRILFGSINPHSDPRKGFPQFIEACRILAAEGWAKRAEVVIFGCSTPDKVPNLGLTTRFVGAIHDDHALARLYAESDVMVAPSLQEAFGVTVVEAMACSTPVVSFSTGGPGEIIIHKKTGYLAQPFDPHSLARGMEWCLADEVRLLKLRAESYKRARAFSLPTVASQYADLYARILGRPDEGCIRPGKSPRGTYTIANDSSAA